MCCDRYESHKRIGSGHVTYLNLEASENRKGAGL